MEERTTNERLATLEAKLEFIRELLSDIKEDVKEQPSQEEVDDLKERLSILEKNYTSLVVKVASVAGGMMVLIEIAAKLFFK